MENFGWTVLASVIGSSIIFFTQRYYRNADSRELEVAKSEIQKDREAFLNKLRLNSEVQFRLYNELWASLTKLEDLVEDLWSRNLTAKLVRDLARTVKQTEDKMRESALVIDRADYLRLEKILDTIKNYRAGKEKLLNLEAVDERTSDEVQRQIDENFELRSEYVDLKKAMFDKMSERIGL